jgi:antitoxin FitA
MAQLVVRNLDEAVKLGLRRRAARHGRSVEAEVREILQAAIKDESDLSPPLGSRIATRFAEVGFEEEVAELHGTQAHPAGLE